MQALSMRQVSRFWVLSLVVGSILGVAAPQATDQQSAQQPAASTTQAVDKQSAQQPAAGPTQAADKQSAQQPGGGPESSRITVRKPDIHVAPFLVDVNLVVVNVTVTDPFDRIVTGLGRTTFRCSMRKSPRRSNPFPPKMHPSQWA